LRRDVWLVGLDEVTRGKPDLPEALTGVPAAVYRIGLVHAPSYFDRVAGYADLVLAGHCHGGQIRLPGLPPLYLPAGCGKYVEGWYEKNGSRLYVTRGLGNTILDMRLFSRPEIAIFDLQPIAR
jgi:predicted MPP superfamily phosphohydrolase